MSNHHLLIETPEVGLPSWNEVAQSEYAELFNERHRRVGHLVQGRFKGILVEREGHLLELIRYIVLNPVRCHAVTFAGHYEWSNYRPWPAFRPLRPGSRSVGRSTSSDQTTQLRTTTYRRFVADTRGASYNPWESLIGQMYLGGAAFCDRMQSLVAAKPRSPEHPRDQRRFVHPTLDAIVVLVADRFDVTLDDLKRKSRGQARKTLAHLAVDDAGLTLRGIDDWMGVTEWAASKMRQTARNLYATDAGFRDRVDQIRAALS